MKTKLVVWISPDLEETSKRKIVSVLETLKADFEMVDDPQSAHAVVIDGERDLQKYDLPKNITCIGIQIPVQPEGIRPVIVQNPSSAIACLCASLKAIRRHEEMCGITS